MGAKRKQTSADIDTAQQVLGATYREAQRRLVAHAYRLGRAIVQSRTPLAARVDHGRWIADCPCGAGVALDETWPEALCYDCCTRHSTTAVVWPQRRAEIEQLLGRRPLKPTRNWDPRESVEDLRRENVAHGVKER